MVVVVVLMLMVVMVDVVVVVVAVATAVAAVILVRAVELYICNESPTFFLSHHMHKDYYDIGKQSAIM